MSIVLMVNLTCPGDHECWHKQHQKTHANPHSTPVFSPRHYIADDGSFVSTGNYKPVKRQSISTLNVAISKLLPKKNQTSDTKLLGLKLIHVSKGPQVDKLIWWDISPFTYLLRKTVLPGSRPGGRLNKKDGLTRYGNSHVKDKTS